MKSKWLKLALLLLGISLVVVLVLLYWPRTTYYDDPEIFGDGEAMEQVVETSWDSDSEETENYWYRIDGETLERKSKTTDEVEVLNADLGKDLEENFHFRIVRVFEEDGLILLTQVFEGGLPAHDLALFDLDSREVETLGLSVSGDYYSPDGTQLVWVEQIIDACGEQKELQMVDFISREQSVLVTLADGESLQKGTDGYGLGQFEDVEWLDDKTVRYGVYDQTKKESYDCDSRNLPKGEDYFLEYREVTL